MKLAFKPLSSLTLETQSPGENLLKVFFSQTSIFLNHIQILIRIQLRDAGVLAMNLQREKETLSTEYDELKHMFDTANECLEMLSNVQVKKSNISHQFNPKMTRKLSASKNLFQQNDLFLIYDWTSTEYVLLLLS